MADKSLAWPKLAAIAELVDKILLELPLRDILSAQSVSPAWHGFITKSTKLQQALFLRPSVDYQLQLNNLSQYHKFDCDCEGAPEPARACHLALQTPFPLPLDWARDSKDDNSYKLVMNPFLQDADCSDGQISAAAMGSLSKTSREASCRKMLLTQPPIKDAIIEGPREGRHLVACKPGADGLTVDDVLELAGILQASSTISPRRSMQVVGFDCCTTPAATLLVEQETPIRGKHQRVVRRVVTPEGIVPVFKTGDY